MYDGGKIPTIMLYFAPAWYAVSCAGLYGVLSYKYPAIVVSVCLSVHVTEAVHAYMQLLLRCTEDSSVEHISCVCRLTFIHTRMNKGK